MKKIIKKIHNQTLIFDYRKLVFWVEESILILSDLHIGKVIHFNKNGISIPKDISFENLKYLNQESKTTNPKMYFFWVIYFILHK